MTTKLCGKSTRFLPFNKGLNNGSGEINLKSGAGNPPSDGMKSAYLWEQILQKDILISLILDFTQELESKDSKRLIFPRYHQFDVVDKLIKDCKKNGVGQKYLIQHSAGSGKSNTISWLAHQLISLHNSNDELVFDSVIVITDRRVLDRQIQNNIKGFNHTKGVIEPITDGSRHLREALQDGKKIIITTIQKFPYIVDDVYQLKTKKFAIIIDEAHSSQSGSNAQKLSEVIRDKNEQDNEEITDEDKILEIIKNKKLQPNASYFAFTATPKPQTLELFGLHSSINMEKFIPFHLYSMKQAIEEGFIIDVLKGYITYKSYYKIIQTIKEDPRYDKKKANAKLRKYVEGDESAISKKAEIMIEHFYDNIQYKVESKARAMVVTSSRMNALKYYFAFKKILENKSSQYKALVAFTGELEYNGKKYSETMLNDMSEEKLKEAFKNEPYRFLIVAEKYQTGFDEPLLHTMYVDKKLSGINAVQTLSRLNRIHKGKDDACVIDFCNTHDDIAKYFSRFYEQTYLKEETDPNKIFDLQDA